MKLLKIATVAALTAATPALAQAQSTPPEAKGCCAKDADGKMACCDADGDGAMECCASMQKDTDNRAAVDHSTMDHSTMDHGARAHSTVDHGGMDHSAMNHSTMDHGAMNHSATPVPAASQPNR